MSDASHAAVMEAHWGGGAAPFGASWQKTMMWIFIVTDGLLFSGLLCGYAFLRMASPLPWPKQTEVFSMPFIALMTFILITSSATMGTAVGASKLGDRKTATRFLFLTILGGAAFLGCQAYEWTHFIGEGARLAGALAGSELGHLGVPPQFPATFFVLTGFHGSHVFSGLVILTITAIRTALGKTPAQGVEMAGLYWHFVDLVWVFIFTLFYLL
ncbi:MAG TPA: cytochrome c oxidase subunit 3 [Vicinamibacteria bacterium]|jgi:cytochrome c oxidase subunit 3|nr:cytochrome c oxidase subunit 3 [Vicinamibacteria bacterium]